MTPKLELPVGPGNCVSAGPLLDEGEDVEVVEDVEDVEDVEVPRHDASLDNLTTLRSEVPPTLF